MRREDFNKLIQKFLCQDSFIDLTRKNKEQIRNKRGCYKNKKSGKPHSHAIFRTFQLVGATGLEPATWWSQTLEPNFLWWFVVLSARYWIFFDALKSTVSEYSGLDCGQIWGQKRFLARGGRCLPVPARKRFFVTLGLGYCTSGQAGMQVFSQR